MYSQLTIVCGTILRKKKPTNKVRHIYLPRIYQNKFHILVNTMYFLLGGGNLSSVKGSLGKCMRDSFKSNLLSISTHIGYVHILHNGEEVGKAAHF